ncbi:rhodanese-like domain-containing protein [Flavobacterium sp. N2820]|jgi:rhodanese-related sulfurtransferase|uniref:rhodanese-like domain-containing protein n=1 Tax=Flavobacterium sp. N2820 TaxID=2986834 RepID=UPI00222587E0|nr:rhodanese-like domain-containing protein [Flavobacterium sp. N2820]
MKIRILSVLVVLMSLTSCIKKQVEGVQVVDIAAYEQQLKQPEIQLIDVRTPEEFSEGHIENAKNINIMGDDFDAQVAALDKTKPVMVYCKSGGRSAKASARLKELGFTTITDLEGGITNWNSENKPTVK